MQRKNTFFNNGLKTFSRNAVNFFCLLMAVVVLQACAPSTPSVGMIQTAIAETLSVASPTLSPSSTDLPSPTATLKPTRTATLTKTPRPTKTSTATPTVTNTPPEPKDQTATAVQATSVAGVTAVAETKVAVFATATEIASYKEIYWRELITYPENHKNEKVIVRGRIFNVVGNDTLQIYIAGTYEAVYIEMEEPFSDLYDDQSLTIYGRVSGKECFKNAYNAEVCQPKIIGDFYTKP